jgi:hypothetical protein
VKTRFPERTCYRLGELSVPSCFLALDDHFARAFSLELPNAPQTHVAVLLAESICARMGEIEMYVYQIGDARKRQRMDKEGDVRAAILTRAFFVGYLGAARGLIDSCAMALSIVHELPLARADRSFASSTFWATLVERRPNVHRRYHTLRLFFNEIIRWSNETPDRVPPLEVLYATFGQFSTRDAQLRMLDEADTDLVTLAYSRRTFNWVDPLQMHDRWKPQFLGLCEKLCDEIRVSVPIRE